MHGIHYCFVSHIIVLFLTFPSELIRSIIIPTIDEDIVSQGSN